MKTLKFVSGARKHLETEGFVPASSRKVAGLQSEWKHVDGRKALVGFGLLSRTGQSSMGAAACWGYIIRMDEVGA